APFVFLIFCNRFPFAFAFASALAFAFRWRQSAPRLFHHAFFHSRCAQREHVSLQYLCPKCIATKYGVWQPGRTHLRSLSSGIEANSSQRSLKRDCALYSNFPGL